MKRLRRDRRDRVRQLRVFCEVARLSSITRAAERLGLTQPAVSIQLRELEYEVGAELLERAEASVMLSAAGERLYALAEPLVRGVDALFDDFSRSLESEGGESVRLAASSAGTSFVLPRYLGRFHKQHPDTVVRVDTVTFHDGLERLLDEKVDFMVSLRDPYPQERVEYHEVCAYGLVVITPLDHPLAGRDSVSAREVRAYPSVVAPTATYSLRFGETFVQALGITENAVVEVGGWALLKRYVEAGIGISVIPSLCVTEADQLSVAKLDADFRPGSFGVFLLRDRPLTPRARDLFRVLLPNAPPAGCQASKPLMFGPAPDA